MTHSRYDPSAHNRVPWNYGAKIGPHRPLNRKQVGAIRFFLDREKRIRDRVLSDLSIDSRLSDCDLVALQIGDLVVGLEVRRRATIAQQKTGRPGQFEIAADARSDLCAWLEPEAARWMTTSSLAALIMHNSQAPDSMPAPLMSELKR